MGLSVWRSHIGLDLRCVRVAAFMMSAIGVTLLVLTHGLILGVWRIVLFCQIVARAVAEVGLAFSRNFRAGSGSSLPGLIALPILVPIVTVGGLWLYRAETWGPRAAMEERMTA